MSRNRVTLSAAFAAAALLSLPAALAADYSPPDGLDVDYNVADGVDVETDLEINVKGVGYANHGRRDDAGDDRSSHA